MYPRTPSKTNAPNSAPGSIPGFPERAPDGSRPASVRRSSTTETQRPELFGYAHSAANFLGLAHHASTRATPLPHITRGASLLYALYQPSARSADWQHPLRCCTCVDDTNANVGGGMHGWPRAVCCKLMDCAAVPLAAPTTTLPSKLHYHTKLSCWRSRTAIPGGI